MPSVPTRGARAKPRTDDCPLRRRRTAPPRLTEAQLAKLTSALEAARDGDFSVRLRADGALAEVATAFNTLVERNQQVTNELVRVSKVVGREGRITERAGVAGAPGSWAEKVGAVNELIDNLARPTIEVARVIDAVADGDLRQRIQLEIDGQPVRGEFRRIGTTVNAMVDQLSSFADEVTRVAREVGTEGKLGGQARVKGVSGTWKDLTDSVNQMASNLTGQVRNIAEVTTAVANGDLSKKVTVDVKGEVLELKNTVNTMVDQLSSFADEVTRVAREVGTDGNLGGQAQVKGVSGVWKDLTENVNTLAGNLTSQVRNIAAVTTAVANGDLSKKITVDVKGEVLELKETINTMVDQLRSFSAEVTRVAKEVGTEGSLGGQAQVEGVSGVWKDLTENVNTLADNLTDQVRNIADVTTAVANGDLSKKITVDVKGEVLEVKETVNTMVDQLRSFAAEVTRVAREVGTEGRLGGQAQVEGVSGVWKDLTDNVNTLAGNLTSQVRNIAAVTTAVANGDLSKKITVDVAGEVARAQGHDQHDGRPALQLRGRGHPRRPRGRHRGQARRPGPGEGRLRHLARPDRQRQLHGLLADRPGAQHRRRHDRGRATATSRRRSPSTSRARSSSSRTRSTRWSTSSAPSPPRSPASRARSAPRASSAARRGSRASPAPGAT